MSRNRRLKLQVFRVVVFLLFGAFFLVPIGAMFEFSTRGSTDTAPRTLAAWQTIFQTPDLVAAIRGEHAPGEIDDGADLERAHVVRARRKVQMDSLEVRHCGHSAASAIGRSHSTVVRRM